jgi:uncharacterized protein
MSYYKGIALDQAAWSPLIAQHPEWFTAILLYGTEAGSGELKLARRLLALAARARA